MKKITALLLTAILALSLCFGAMADEIWTPGKTVFIDVGARAGGGTDLIIRYVTQALGELNRVCWDGGQLIIPTYMNRDRKGKTSTFATAVGKAGADFKRQFTPDSYRQFFLDAGYRDVRITLADGRIPCAVAVMTKKRDGGGAS